MADDKVAALLGIFERAEQAAFSDTSLQQVEQQYSQALSSAPRVTPLLVAYNRFRLRHGPRLRARRPKVLVGYVNDTNFPNFHTIPLLRVADVVSLTTHAPRDSTIDRVSYDRRSERLPDILRRLPEGFEPDLFWDNQVEHRHVIPLGLEDAPFPTAAGLCHMFLAPALQHLCRVFDIVAPLSRGFIPRVRAMTDAAVIDVPFGANWASFDSLVQPAWDKSVDVALTIGPTPPGVIYGDGRARLFEAIQDFRRRHGGRYAISIESNLDRPRYLKLLQDARIVVNAISVNGPYNYRTCEAINAGALLLQHDGSGLAVETDIRDYFRDGEHLVTFTFETLEEKLIHFLAHPDEAEAIARKGHAFLTAEYRYETIYRRVFREAKLAGRRRHRPASERADFDVAMAYWCQSNQHFMQHPVNALPYVMTQAPALRSNNLMVMIPALIEAGESAEVFRQLEGLPVVAQAFRRSTWDGICCLRDAAADDPTVLWNFAMLALERGRATSEHLQDAEAGLDRLERGVGIPFVPADVVLAHARIPGMSEGDRHESWLRDLAVPLLKSDGSRQEVAALFVRFMRHRCDEARRSRQAID
jgi:glycosyltransferase involved in cell wall biosynthesis